MCLVLRDKVADTVPVLDGRRGVSNQSHTARGLLLRQLLRFVRDLGALLCDLCIEFRDVRANGGGTGRVSVLVCDPEEILLDCPVGLEPLDVGVEGSEFQSQVANLLLRFLGRVPNGLEGRGDCIKRGLAAEPNLERPAPYRRQVVRVVHKGAHLFGNVTQDPPELPG